MNDKLQDAATKAGKQNVILVLENETSCNTATGAEAAKVLRLVKSRWLMLNWDPGNAAGRGILRALRQAENVHEGQRDLPRARDQLSHLLHLEEAVRGSTKTQERIGAWAELALVIFATNDAFPAELSDDLVEVRSAPQGSET